MESTENKIIYKISNHASERYAERIMDKDNANNINRFIMDNKEKIKIDINKMIEFGECIFTGKQSQKDGKGKVLDVYLNGCYVILVDSSNETVVTLFKIDLGLGDDFNREYISKMLDKLNDSKAVLEKIQLEVQKESDIYKELINDAEVQINEYKSMIKNLEELCVGYRAIIGNNNVRVTQANKNIADVLNMLIGKREF